MQPTKLVWVSSQELKQKLEQQYGQEIEYKILK
jgi:hypothetical protein